PFRTWSKRGDCSTQERLRLDASHHRLARDPSDRCAGTPPDLIQRRTTAMAMPAGVIIATARLAHEGAILLDQESTTPITRRAAKPRTQLRVPALPPFFLDPHGLGLIAVADGDLRKTEQPTNPDARMGLQQLAITPRPGPLISEAALSKGHVVKITLAPHLS